ncbi:POT family MFS transporter [Aggregicoccus sp. 17bor-14]|uniref:POT-type proton-dependent oligopeptide transporter n=1 Tax=Myxococcaceae TaxID=31 RepID=UPI00129CAA4A|nr:MULTISPECIES: MFS transporter [Myxococcaceae]MBF5041121.1 MFS transporter [Simulacricoccus sp. 17bor-14]MRI86908.1 POT family MFS transporter [Aggregicoccus sp. 17bor-14]
MALSTELPAQHERMPPQARYIVGTEGCERFSYYGMTAILVLYMAKHLGFDEVEAREKYHWFNFGAYFAPLLGGFLADRFLGRYATILFVSLGYVLGHALLAVVPGSLGLYVGCLFIAMGAGGIKPCVSTFMGDQFGPEKQHLVEKAYGWFYFAINVGSVLGVLLIPKVLDWYGPHWAFGLPGIAMALALLVFYLGRRQYVKPPPTGPNPHGFLRVSLAALGAKPAPGQSRLDSLRGRFPAEAVDGVRAAIRIVFVFSLVSVFWALYFQYGSSWTLQADKMGLGLPGGMRMSAGQLSSYASAWVLVLIPVMNRLYDVLRRRGLEVTPLRKMTAGMFIAALAFLTAALVEHRIQSGHAPHALWQGVQYFFLGVAEVLISVTGLEFAFTQAPPSMKSVIMGFWFVFIAVGNAITALVPLFVPFTGVAYYLFFSALMVVFAVLFALVARWYKPVDFTTPAEPRGSAA